MSFLVVTFSQMAGDGEKRNTQNRLEHANDRSEEKQVQEEILAEKQVCFISQIVIST